MLVTVPCNLCGADDARPLYPNTLGHDDRSGSIERYRCTSSGYGRHYAIVQCNRCGLIYASPRCDEREAESSYEQVVDKLYVQERRGRELTFRKNVRPLQAELAGVARPRVLDIGCYAGIFLEVAAELGWDAWGVEPSAWAAGEARRRGLNVINGTLADAEFAPGSFDAVTLWDVIEHLTDPQAEMRRVNHVLRPGGLVCVHTIDAGSLLHRLMGHRWPWLMEMHLYYFSRRTMARLLEQAGFRVVRQFIQGRYTLLDYLLHQGEAVSPRLSRLLRGGARRLGIGQWAIPINTGDLLTTLARKAGDLEA